MRLHRSLPPTAIGLLLLGLVLGPAGWSGPQPAHAAGVVGTGSPDTCTEAALDAALAGGGTVTFNCGADPHLIETTTPKIINQATTLDGGGKITLDGQDNHRLFVNYAALTLRNIVLTHGYASGTDGGAIIHFPTHAALVLENTTVSHSQSTDNGGAIVTYGPMTITNSLFEYNTADNGGALYSRFAFASTLIVDSVLRFNYATDAAQGWGGAILAWDPAPVTLQGSEVYSNAAYYGGGVYVYGDATLVKVQAGAHLYGNTAHWGGGLFNTGDLELAGVTLSNNTAAESGGGIYNTGELALAGVTLDGNTAGEDGGGIFLFAGSAALSQVLFHHNGAGLLGGGLFVEYTQASLTDSTFTDNEAYAGGGLGNTGIVTMTNVTLAGNSAAVTTGGGLYNFGRATLTNVTLSDNWAQNYGGAIAQSGAGSVLTLTHGTVHNNEVIATSIGGGLYRHTSGGPLTVRNSIVADSVGTNCQSVTNGGYNLATDASCGFNQIEDAMLAALDDNGGLTPTQLPQEGSPAIDFVLFGCPPPAHDQRNWPRPYGDNCDAGAVEVQPLLAFLFLPLIER